jgi:hypothetical protein
MSYKLVINNLKKKQRDYLLPTLIFVFFYICFGVFILFYDFDPSIKVQDQEKQTVTTNTNVLGETDEEEKRDIENIVEYKSELFQYTEDVISFLYFNDSAFRLMDEDKSKGEEYAKVIMMGGELCIYCNYEYSKNDIPLRIEKKINNIESLMEELSKLFVDSGNLMIKYYNTDDTKEMRTIVPKVREVIGEAYEIRMLIEEICLEVQDEIE